MLQSSPVAIDLRKSVGERAGMAFVTVLMVAVTAFMLIIALGVFGQSPVLGLFLLAIAGFLGFLVWYIGREAQGAWRIRIRVQGDAVHFVLPAVRGFAVQAPVDTWVPLSAIAGVEAREEAFRTFGLTTIQYAYAVVLHGGGRIVLGADRPPKAPFFSKVADTVAQAAGAPAILVRGLYDASAGPLLMAGNTAPDWNAAPVDEATAQKRRRGVALTWQILTAVILLVTVARGCSAFLGH